MSIVFNTLLAPFIGFVIILVDYYKWRSTDIVQKRIFTIMVFALLAAMFSDFIFSFSVGRNIGPLTPFNLTLATFYFWLISFGVSLMVLLLEHTFNGHNSPRFKKIVAFVAVVNSAYLLLLITNFFTRSLFYMTYYNEYNRAEWFLLVFSPAVFWLLATIFVFAGRKRIGRHIVCLGLLSASIILISFLSDTLNETSLVALPGFFVSVLLYYLFAIRKSSLIDYLTNTYNRRGFSEFLENMAKSGDRRDYVFIVIDIEGFKKINEELGYKQGDGVLRDLSDILRGSIRRSDFIARYGGDEFAVIAAANNLRPIRENINRAIADFNDKKLRAYTIEVTIGGDVFEAGDKRSPMEFFSHVDGLMYAEKDKRKKEKDICDGETKFLDKG